MVAAHSRSSSKTLPCALLVGGVWLLATLVSGPTDAQPFLTAQPVLRGRTTVRGFKEDFEAWRGELEPEQRELLERQAKGEFDKNFRKSDEFKKELPEDKVQSFAKILGKFFDSEAEDYKKAAGADVPDYDGLLKPTGNQTFNFSLRNVIVKVNRDADRRYNFAMMKIQQAAEKGELYPQSSPMLEKWVVQNNDTESHAKALEVIEAMKTLVADPKTDPESKKAYQKWVEQGIPPIGEDIKLKVPSVLVSQFQWIWQDIRQKREEFSKGKSQAEIDAYLRDEPEKIFKPMADFAIENYVRARDEVQEEADKLKKFFRSQEERPGTKADILKEIWAKLAEDSDKPLPPLDEELLAELEKIPAIVPGEFRHSWGIADKLYKSEAIDAFGMKYLVGVFETKDEARKAFADWSSEYDKARAEMKTELQQFSKQEQARADKDQAGSERIRKVLEEARR